MTAYGTMVAGAPSRLLPPSVPFRFFGMAAINHLAAWIVLAVCAADATEFVGGLGPPLAVLHLITLGVLTMTAMGAAFQLLPVATGAPLRSLRACRAVFWYAALGVPVLAYGMGKASLWGLGLGGTAVLTALAIFAHQISGNLRATSALPLVTAHTWTALGALVVLAVMGALLSADFPLAFLPDHTRTAALHLTLATYGFMGLLAQGFSLILIPLFCLAPPPDLRLGRASFVLWLSALCVGIPALLGGWSPAILTAGILALGAAALHVACMSQVMARRMRRHLGGSFVLIRLSWVLLPTSIVLGLISAAGLGGPRMPVLFVFVLVFGWLLTFLLGVLQRIMPFLASMHSAGSGRKPILVSALTAEQPLRVHLVCHLIALALVVAGLLAARPLLVLAGAVAGCVGALGFATFAVLLGRRLTHHLSATP